MSKPVKIFTLIFLVIFMCSYITYGIEPDSTAVQPACPDLPEAVPSPAPGPETQSRSEASPAPLSEQPAEKNTDESRLRAASDFSSEIESIVMDRITGFYKKGGEGALGIYIRELKTGFEYAYNAEKTNPDNPEEGYFNTASTCKILSAAVMYHMNSCGELDLDKTYTDSVTKSRYNLKKMLPKMLSHSVNDYFNITLRHLGSEKLNSALRELGLEHSLIYSEIMPAQHCSVSNNIKRYGISRSPRTTPRDLGYVLELLYEGKTFGEENSRQFMKGLLDNIYSNRLPSGIGYRSSVAHKTGTSAGEGVYNDAGIILLEDNPYIMIVMSKGSGSNVQSLFRNIAGEVYDYMKKRTENQSGSSTSLQEN